MPEMNRNNNTIRTNGMFKKCEPLRLQWLGSLQNPERTQLFFTPVVNWNLYDGFMPGLALYNSVFPAKHFEYFLMPVFSFNTKHLNGNAKIAYHILPQNNWMHQITITASSLKYSYFQEGDSFYGDYLRLHQEIKIDLTKKSVRSSASDYLKIRNDLFFSPGANLKLIGEINLYSTNNYQTATFNHVNTNVLNSFSYNINIQRGQKSGSTAFIKTWVEAKFHATYNKPKTGLDVRLFAGDFIYDGDPTESQLFHMSAGTGEQDYLFDEIYFGRSEYQGWLSQQTVMNDGAMKVRTDYTIGMGETNKWLLSTNLRSTLPFKSPLFLFADGGVYAGTNADLYGWGWDGGTGISLFAHTIEIYLPLVFSQNIRSNQLTYPEYDQWFEHLMFTVNITKLNPFNLIRQINL